MSFKQQRVAVIIPAHNEALSIDRVVRELVALRAPDTQTDYASLIDDIIVCDNGSTDKTAEIAARAGATVVHESTMGYGAACLRGLQALKDMSSPKLTDNLANNFTNRSTPTAAYRAVNVTTQNTHHKKPAPNFVIFIDGDYSVKTNEIMSLLEQLHAGNDLVVGSRENSLLQAGALSPHQRFGNALALSLIHI